MMVRFGRVQLLSHPVSLAYLEMKWKAYGSMFFYINLIFYSLFLFSMSWLMISMNLDPVMSPHTNDSMIRGLESLLDPAEDSRRINSDHRIVLTFSLFFLIVNFAKEFLQIWQQRLAYFMEVVNLIEWSLYVSSAVFVVPLLFQPGNDQPLWEFGVVAIFLAWFNLLMHMQRTDSMGLYVVMFLHIFRTVVKVLLVFSVLFIGFGLAFFILLTNDPESGFNNPWIATTQVVMMMMGDWNFRLNFVSPRMEGAPYPLLYPDLSYVFLLIFVLLMPILFINLLIGLAVGDIEMVQKDARLKRLAMQVDYHTELEERLPQWVLKRVNKKVLIVRPNIISSGNLFPSLVRWFKRNGGGSVFEGTGAVKGGGQGELGQKGPAGASLAPSTLHAIEAANANLLLEMDKIKNRQKDMHGFMEKQYELIKLLVQKLEIVSEADQVDEGDREEEERWSSVEESGWLKGLRHTIAASLRRHKEIP